MGNNLSPEINSRANLNVSTSSDEKVRFYSKDNFNGNVYVVDYGNYTVSYFADKISPDSVFSMTIPPLTTVKLFCGEMYDYGGQGAFHVTNITKNKVSVPQFPEHVQGRIKSISVIKHDANFFAASAIVDSSILGITGINNAQMGTSNLTSINPNTNQNQTPDNTISNYKIENFNNTKSTTSLDHTPKSNKSKPTFNIDSIDLSLFIYLLNLMCLMLIIVILLLIINNYLLP